MVKNIKRILIISIVLTLVLIGGAVYLLSYKPILIIPFTYQISEKVIAGQNEAQNADILIIGDRMGLYLNQYLEPLKSDLAKEMKKEMNVVNWSKENEGLHRTLYKIKSLKKLPPLIIYHGGSSEWFEKKFNPNDRDKILYNFNKYHDEKISSLIITFPELSKAIYKKVDLFNLHELPKKYHLKPETNFTAKEIEFLYYQEELKELIDYIKRNKSNIILITTPINANVRPKEACPIASTNTIVEMQQDIENLLKEGNSKDAFNKAQILAKESMSNATTYYLLGTAAKSIGENKIAREALINANVYDCYSWRGNGVFNSIILKTANHFQVETIDYATLLLNSQIQGNEVFFDDIFPQNIYYNNLITELTTSVKKYFNIK